MSVVPSAGGCWASGPRSPSGTGSAAAGWLLPSGCSDSSCGSVGSWTSGVSSAGRPVAEPSGRSAADPSGRTGCDGATESVAASSSSVGTGEDTPADSGAGASYDAGAGAAVPDRSGEVGSWLPCAVGSGAGDDDAASCAVVRIPVPRGMLRRRSKRSTRDVMPRVVWSAEGSRMRAHSSSRCNCGEVAPVISLRASLVMSAERESSAAPSWVAWFRNRLIWSVGIPCRMFAAESGTALTTTRSRKRSSRSSTKRRGSWPVWMTRSTDAKTVAASPAAKASTTSSSRAACV